MAFEHTISGHQVYQFKISFFSFFLSTVQLYTYQPNFMTKYSTVSARLDLELLTSTQRMREAFSNDEFRGAKKKNEELEKYQEVHTL